MVIDDQAVMVITSGGDEVVAAENVMVDKYFVAFFLLFRISYVVMM